MTAEALVGLIWSELPEVTLADETVSAGKGLNDGAEPEGHEAKNDAASVTTAEGVMPTCADQR